MMPPHCRVSVCECVCEEDLYSHTVTCCDGSAQTVPKSQPLAHSNFESKGRSAFNFLRSYNNTQRAGKYHRS